MVLSLLEKEILKVQYVFRENGDIYISFKNCHQLMRHSDKFTHKLVLMSSY